MNTLRTSLITLLATGSLFAATNASALPANWFDELPAWSSTASSCSVDESSTGRYEFSGAQFRYKGDKISPASRMASTAGGITTGGIVIGIGTGLQPITVRCNVTPIYDYVPAVPAAPGDFVGTNAYWKSADWNTLIVGYTDPDGISTKTQVTASLRKLNRATLTESVIAVFNSNTSANAVANEDVKQFTHSFDFLHNEYYVEINLTRQDATVATPVAYSVRLAKGDVMQVPQ